MNGYELSHNWFDFCFENPEKINPSHTAIYFFAIEHCNRMGWKTKFGFPTQMAMDALGISKHSTYIKYFNDLVEWGFLILVQKSSNQYSSNIISLNFALPKKGKALAKAFIKHGEKHSLSDGKSTVISDGSIIKQYNLEPNNFKPNNEEQGNQTSTENELGDLFKGLNIEFSNYINARIQSNAPFKFHEEWAKRKDCYYGLVLNNQNFQKKIKNKNISEDDAKKYISEWLKHLYENKLDQQWDTITDMCTHCLNFINLKLSNNGKPNAKNTVAYIQQQQMREPARDFGEL